MKEILTTPWGPIGLVGLIYATFLYMNLSRRLGAVTKMPPYYRGFFLSTVFLGVALVAHVERKTAYLSAAPETAFLLSPLFGLVFYHIPLFLGVVVDLIIVWKYWSWLLKEGL
ncbi:MAG TPA: hypothetical protein G4O00_06840 [Thermoflexia bacterium]|jgi:hypothetical protein|nr:hypothetical protein [Thermoflexia bacterium]